MNPEKTMIAQFAEKIMDWKNLKGTVTDIGVELEGDIGTLEGTVHGTVPNYYEDAMALWASGAYIRNKGLVLEFIQSLQELTGATDMSDLNDIFKLVFAQPQIVVQAAVRAFDKDQSYNPS